MGVPFFYRWLQQRFSGITTVMPARELARYCQEHRIATLGLDMNGIIHTEASKVYMYGDYENQHPQVVAELLRTPPEELERRHMQAITEAVYDLVVKLDVRSTLIIAVDGPAPLAKVQQQKQRRFKARATLLRQEDGYLEYETGADVPTTPASSTAALFDSNSITPGTAFMERLDQHMRAWLQLNRANLPPRVIYSSHRVPGEGEHKIADYMRTLQYGPAHDNLYHVVHGLDADLIMLGALSPRRNYLLLREDRQRNGEERVHILKIDLVREQLTARLRHGARSVDDFVLLSFLAGNDFLPAFPSISIGAEGLDKLMGLYERLGRGLTRENQTIDWAAVHAFMRLYEEEEARLLLAQWQRGSTYPALPLAAAITVEGRAGLDVVAARAREEAALAARTTTRRSDAPYRPVAARTDQATAQLDLARYYTAYYERALGPAHPPAERTVVASEWLAGIAWVYRYYAHGSHAINVEWLYHYNYVPLARDISASLQRDPRHDFEWEATGRRGRFLLPFEQLVAVLPPASATLLPSALQPLITARDSPLTDLFPAQFRADLNGKMKEHEAVALLPAVDATRVRAAVAEELADVVLGDFDARRNEHDRDLMLKTYCGFTPIGYNGDPCARR